MSQKDAVAIITAPGDDDALANALKSNTSHNDPTGITASALIQRLMACEVPTLDDIMPPLDRQGRRGPLNADERDYKRRRDFLATVLEQMASGQADLIAGFESLRRQLIESETRVRELSRSVADLNAGNAQLNDYTADLRGQLQRIRLDRPTTLVAATQFTRLTGLELTGFRAVLDDVIECRAVDRRIRLNFHASPGGLTIVLESGHANRFDLLKDGQIPAKDALAILSLLGLKRELRDVLSKLAASDALGASVRHEPVIPAFSAVALVKASPSGFNRYGENYLD